MAIAMAQNIAVYDSLYVAAAKRLGGTLFTADQKLCTAASRIVESKLLKHET
jgi:predicted nucleic acid-binding protein